MKDNISRMYELAGIKETPQETISQGKFPIRVNYLSYPPFTAEKQLELIKWLATKFILGNFKGIDDGLYNFNLCLTVTPLNKHIISEHIEYKQALAGLVCKLWEDLTEQQREEVRGILCQ